ncbi:hypothetical protein BGX26_007495, partial [Mortierella sp. AD094]
MDTLIRVSEKSMTYSRTSEEKRELQQLKDSILTREELKIVQDLVTVLEPIYKFSQQVEASNLSAISQVYPWASDMIHSSQDTSDGIQAKIAIAVRDSLRKAISKQWSPKHIPDAIAIVTHLNPAARNSTLAEHTRRLITQKLLDQFENLASDITPIEQDTSDDEDYIDERG